MSSIHLCRFTFLAVLLLPINSQGMNPEYEKWRNESLSEFSEYVDERDKDFTNYLKTQWEEMALMHGLVKDKKPKPRIIPTAPTHVPKVKPDTELPEEKKLAEKPFSFEEKKKSRHVPTVTPDNKRAMPAAKIPPKVIPHKDIPIKKKQRDASILGDLDHILVKFYGYSYSVNYKPKVFGKLRSPISNNTISEWWDNASRSDYPATINSVKHITDKLQLGDWGTFRFISALAETIHPGDLNTQNAITWFTMVKLNYNIKAGYNNASLQLLVPSTQKIYGKPYLQLAGDRYYMLTARSGNAGRIMTYRNKYPNSDNRLNITIPVNHTNGSEYELQKRDFKFNYERYKYTLGVNYNENYVQYLDSYPQMDFDIYFNSEISDQVSSQFVQQLKPIIRGKSKEEAINILLRFVQTAFPYKTDEEQFGTENYLLPDEIIHYSFSDCEDRSFLFARLVKALLGIDVVGLHYPGHLATAVLLDKPVGKTYSHRGKLYSVADPTYINASLGMVMPQLKDVTPKIITIQ